MIPTGAVMNNPSGLMIFSGSEDAVKFSYLYENLVTKVWQDNDKSEKIVSYVARSAFDFDFDHFMMDNGPTDEAKDCSKVKGVMLEKFSVRKTESEIVK